LYQVAAGPFIPRSDGFVSVIKECDEAISYAITSRSGKKDSQEADDKFDEAIRRLRDYQSEFHPLYINTISGIKYCIADPLLGLEVGRQFRIR